MLDPQLDARSGIPLWAQLAETLRDGIEAGRFVDHFPSEPELVEEFKVSRSTVREAIRYLRSEGYLESRQGKGTFVVASESFESLHNHRFSLAGRIAESGLAEVAELLWKGSVDEPMLADRLGLNSHHFYLIERLRGSQHERLALERAYLPRVNADSFEGVDLTQAGSLYAVLQSGTGITVTAGTDEVSAAMPSSTEANLLGVSVDEPVLVVERITYSHQEIVEFRRTILVPARVRFRAEWGR
ncbi:GntR family transcriptional regulator [Ferrimicrobium acidiphilum]|uniref:HTH-type transcriptional repressor PhnF n=1 Tax=Ferrimicrobium acidiphilum DSM 19497 TaxID=1121877 RepID=A0A0D8FZ03_9ACTN|nr:GntR family transcriptional regulator [Ferrimicrobium acidiphilum]KJE78172.1 HTH-type transcriptional repressor PhnF [Ferrimicrobium acidiphilum DSM 19497]